MINRCIMIFPHFHNMEKIQEIRKRYDPLCNHVAPHITLVFPFRSSLDRRSLEDHIRKSVKDVGPFKVTLEGISKEGGHFLFLNITEGTEQIIELHKRLYTGLLSEYYPDFLKNAHFKPHLTIGRTSDSEQLEEAYNDCKELGEVFQDTITAITVENIDENENSIIEMSIELKDGD